MGCCSCDFLWEVFSSRFQPLLQVGGSSYTIFSEVPKITSPGKTSCSLRWTLYEGKCYYFSTLQKTWVESQKECARLNSHLAIINNKAELAFLNSKTQTADYFIGLRNSNGQWKWIDDTKFDPGLSHIKMKFLFYS